MWLMKNSNQNLGSEESSNIWKIKLQEDKKCDEPIMRRNSSMVLEVNLKTHVVVSEKEKKPRRRRKKHHRPNNSEHVDFVKNVLKDDYQWHRLKQRIVESQVITEMAVLEVTQRYLNERRLSMLEKEEKCDVNSLEDDSCEKESFGGMKRFWKRLSMDMVITTQTFRNALRRDSA